MVSKSAQIMIHRQYGIWSKERTTRRNTALKNLEAQRKLDISELQGNHSIKIQAQYDQYRIDISDLNFREKEEIAGGSAWTPPWL